MDLNEMMIDLRKCNKWFQDRFPNKDVITIDNLLSDYEDLIWENDELRDEIKHLEEDDDSGYDYTDYMNDKICEIEYK